MAKSPKPITNQRLGTLLTRLGFEKSETTEKFQRAWRHPKTGTVIFLPANKSDEPPLEINLLSVRTRLEADGHIEGPVFDEFLTTGNLPALR